jgi:hypothetical protein
MRTSPRSVPGSRNVAVARPARARTGDGPLALPAWLDGASDRWWGLTPRRRTIALLLLIAAIAAASVVRTFTAPLGPPTTVLVATADLPAGTTLDTEVVHATRWPGDLVPDGAATLADGTLTTSLPSGAVLTDAHMTADGLGGVVAPGRAAVPLPVELVPDVPVGTRLRVVATDVDGTGRVLADDAEVAAADGVWVWLAVDDAAATDVAAAGVRGGVALAVLPP